MYQQPIKIQTRNFAFDAKINEQQPIEIQTRNLDMDSNISQQQPIKIQTRNLDFDAKINDQQPTEIEKESVNSQSNQINEESSSNLQTLSPTMSTIYADLEEYSLSFRSMISLWTNWTEQSELAFINVAEILVVDLNCTRNSVVKLDDQYYKNSCRKVFYTMDYINGILCTYKVAERFTTSSKDNTFKQLLEENGVEFQYDWVNIQTDIIKAPYMIEPESNNHIRIIYILVIDVAVVSIVILGICGFWRKKEVITFLSSGSNNTPCPSSPTSAQNSPAFGANP
mmetsp:Transcript_18618/g.27498  ORF Transcript_18618/g.27498 Transcript_18618/m.27498 type:complete len:283 (-) Transcript_18618:64-912(-)